MNVAEDLIRKWPHVNVESSCPTREKLLQILADECRESMEVEELVNDPTTGQPGLVKHNKEYTQLILCLTELSNFLGINSAHMIDFLTGAFDKENFEVKTKNKGDNIIPGIYLTMIACTTPSNITRYLKEDVISGGFSRRALFVYTAEDGDPIAFPVITKEAEAAWTSCVAWGQQLGQVQGAFEWTPEAKEWYKPWYEALFRKTQRHTDMQTRGYYRSKHIQLLKVAMLFALAESTDLLMKVEYLQSALAVLEESEKNLSKVFEGMGRNELSAVSTRIVEMLELADTPIPLKEVDAQFFREADGRELYGIMQHLAKIGKIVNHDQTNSQGQVVRKLVSTPFIMERWLKEQQLGGATPSVPRQMDS